MVKLLKIGARYWKEILIVFLTTTTYHFWSKSRTSPDVVELQQRIKEYSKATEELLIASSKQTNFVENLDTYTKVTTEKPDGTRTVKETHRKKNAKVISKTDDKINSRREAETSTDKQVQLRTETRKSSYSIGLSLPPKLAPSYKDMRIDIGKRIGQSPFEVTMGGNPWKRQITIGIRVSL